MHKFVHSCPVPLTRNTRVYIHAINENENTNASTRHSMVILTPVSRYLASEIFRRGTTVMVASTPFRQSQTHAKGLSVSTFRPCDDASKGKASQSGMHERPCANGAQGYFSRSLQDMLLPSSTTANRPPALAPAPRSFENEKVKHRQHFKTNELASVTLGRKSTTTAVTSNGGVIAGGRSVAELAACSTWSGFWAVQ